jgi:hypothetical protein
MAMATTAMFEQHSQLLDALASHWSNQWLDVSWETRTGLDGRLAAACFLGRSRITGREELLCGLRPAELGSPAWCAEEGPPRRPILLAEAPSLSRLVDILMAKGCSGMHGVQTETSTHARASP